MINEDLNKVPDLELFFSLSKPSTSSLKVNNLYFNWIDPCQDTLKRIFEGPTDFKVLDLQLRTRRWFSDETKMFQRYGYGIVTEKIFPSLETLKLNNLVGKQAVRFIANILNAAPNLRRIEGASYSGFRRNPHHIKDPAHLQLLIEAKKLHLINMCRLTFDKETVASGLLVRDKLHGFQPAFLEILFDFFSSEQMDAWARIRSVLEEILWTVKDSVEELCGNNHLSIQEKLTLPKFSKLRRLNLIGFGENHPILHPGIRNRDIFPKLEEIRLELNGPMEQDIYFPSWSHVQEIPAVRSLEIVSSCEINKTFLETITLACPNLQCLELSVGAFSFPDLIWLGPFIWEKLSRLKKLGLSSGLSCLQYSFQVMESWVTGFSLDTVRQLRAASTEDWPSLEEVEHQRINPSILNMTELEKLKINFKLYKGEDNVPNFFLIFKYAFDLMPGLAVDIIPSTYI